MEQTRFNPDRMRDLRVSQGMRQADLAVAAKISRASVINYESGKRIPPFDAMSKIAAALGVPVTTLLDDTPDVPAPEKGSQGPSPEAGESAPSTIQVTHKKTLFPSTSDEGFQESQRRRKGELELVVRLGGHSYTTTLPLDQATDEDIRVVLDTLRSLAERTRQGDGND